MLPITTAQERSQLRVEGVAFFLEEMASRLGRVDETGDFVLSAARTREALQQALAAPHIPQSGDPHELAYYQGAADMLALLFLEAEPEIAALADNAESSQLPLPFNPGDPHVN